MPFQPGNPGGPGRPPGRKNYIDVLRERLESERERDAIVERRFKLAKSKDDRISLQAIDSLEDRVLGKAVQATKLEVGLDENTAKRLAEIADKLNLG